MKIMFLFISLMLIVSLVSCYDETDTITFYKNGKIEFESIITFNTTVDSIENYEFHIKNTVQELKKSNWKVNWEWISKTPPYQAKITGYGKIKKIDDETLYYKFANSSPKVYAWQFPLGLFQEGDDTRKIFISQNSVEVKCSGKIINAFFANKNDKYILDLN